MVTFLFYFLDYFDLKRDERKLIKTYQVMTQYLVYSINHLKKKNNIINNLAQQQSQYNETAESIIDRQKKKIKELEKLNSDSTNNCMNMEFLIKHLKLEPLIMKLGIKSFMNNENIDAPINEREYENMKKEIKSNEKQNIEEDDVDII